MLVGLNQLYLQQVNYNILCRLTQIGKHSSTFLKLNYSLVIAVKWFTFVVSIMKLFTTCDGRQR